jgi:hypothetical protein
VQALEVFRYAGVIKAVGALPHPALDIERGHHSRKK